MRSKERGRGSGKGEGDIPKGKSQVLLAISIMVLRRLNGRWKKVGLVRGGLRTVLVLRLRECSKWK
jgi:hypothetical protein